MNPEKLAEWSAVTYGLARPVVCELLRSYTNDVYAVRCPGGPFVVKIYGRGWRIGPEILYEVALVRHLAARGLRIARPIADRSDEFVNEMATGDGPRHAVLFEYAPGAKPEPPFTPQLYHAFGRAIARMHNLSDDFVTEHPRRPLDLHCLVDEPLALTLALFENAGDRRSLVDAAARVKDRIVALASQGLDWGPIHNDATLDNLHVTGDGEVFLYDLDSGGPGWRAADLQGWAAGNAEYRERWEAYLRGYSEIRSLNPTDLLAAPYMHVALDFWDLKINLDQRILRQGEARARDYLSEQVARIRERVRVLLPD